MKFHLSLSLQHIALVRLAGNLWKSNFILEELIHLSHLRFIDILEKVIPVKIKKIRHEVYHHLVLTSTLKNELERYINVFVKLCVHWTLHCAKCYLSVKCYLMTLANMHFTDMGKIDVLKTTQLLIADDSLTIKDRYTLACECCMEEEILSLWQELKRNYPLTPENVHYTSLKHYWAYNIELPSVLKVLPRNVIRETEFPEVSRRQFDDSCSHLDRIGNETTMPLYYGLYLSVCRGNSVGTKYFLEKLKKSESETQLFEFLKLKCLHFMQFTFADFPNISHCMGLLLNSLSEKYQLRYFKENFSVALQYFVYWPLSNYFEEVFPFFLEISKDVNEIYSAYLDRERFYSLISEAAMTRNTFTPEGKFQIMFESYWGILDPSVKKHYIESNEFAFQLCMLVQLKQTCFIPLLLQDVKRVVMDFASASDILIISSIIAYGGKLDILKSYLQERFSNGDKTTLKNIVDFVGAVAEDNYFKCSPEKQNALGHMVSNFEIAPLEMKKATEILTKICFVYSYEERLHNN